MDEILYESLTQYYHALEVQGYLSRADSYKLLVLIFYRDYTLQDFRGTLTREDYHLIEKALDCLYGSSCLIPYPDYLKMGKLHLGEMTEMAQRLKNIEDTEVVKLLHDIETEGDTRSDILIEESEDE